MLSNNYLITILLKYIFKKNVYTYQSIISQKGPCKLCAAPLGGFLGNWLSCRVTILLGGLLSSAGLILSSFASSLEQLYFCTGVLTGNILHNPIIMPLLFLLDA